MNCQQCGIRDAGFHYQANINGARIELNLCVACAHELQGAVRSGGAARLGGFADLFSGESFGGSLLEQALFGDRRGVSQPNRSGFMPPTPQVVPEPSEAKIPLEADVSLKQRRQLNALKAELAAVIEAQNFERAAELRDEIHRLEQGQ